MERWSYMMWRSLTLIFDARTLAAVTLLGERPRTGSLTLGLGVAGLILPGPRGGEENALPAPPIAAPDASGGG